LPPVVAWEEGKAYLWQKVGNAGYFMPVSHVDDIGLDDLVGIEQQKAHSIPIPYSLCKGCLPIMLFYGVHMALESRHSSKHF